MNLIYIIKFDNYSRNVKQEDFHQPEKGFKTRRKL